MLLRTVALFFGIASTFGVSSAIDGTPLSSAAEQTELEAVNATAEDEEDSIFTTSSDFSDLKSFVKEGDLPILEALYSRKGFNLNGKVMSLIGGLKKKNKSKDCEHFLFDYQLKEAIKKSDGVVNLCPSIIFFRDSIVLDRDIELNCVGFPGTCIFYGQGKTRFFLTDFYIQGLKVKGSSLFESETSSTFENIYQPISNEETSDQDSESNSAFEDIYQPILDEETSDQDSESNSAFEGIYQPPSNEGMSDQDSGSKKIRKEEFRRNYRRGGNYAQRNELDFGVAQDQGLNQTFSGIAFVKGFTTEDGGAMALLRSGTKVIDHCLFLYNVAEGAEDSIGNPVIAGGALASYDGITKIRNSLFLDNRVEIVQDGISSSGGAVGVASARHVVLKDSLFISNEARQSSLVDVKNGANGGAVAIQNIGKVEIENNVFTSNKVQALANGFGGALNVFYLENTTIPITVMKNNIFKWNSVLNVVRGNFDGVGGAVAVYYGNITLDGNIFWGNKCNATYAYSGAFDIDSATADIQNSKFINNRVEGYDVAFGGASDLNGLVKVKDCFYAGNTATNFGGAISLSASINSTTRDLQVMDTILSNNKADIGGAIYINLDEEVKTNVLLRGNKVVLPNFAKVECDGVAIFYKVTQKYTCELANVYLDLSA